MPKIHAATGPHGHLCDTIARLWSASTTEVLGLMVTDQAEPWRGIALTFHERQSG